MVPGIGPSPCLLMIVGEAPGREEEKVGLPFVGPSGRLLDTALQVLGIDRSQVYVTNIVKTIPLDDQERIRRPTDEEIEEWRPLFEEELQNVAPVAILALGKTASRTLTGLVLPAGSKVDNVYTAWHPAYLLRNGKRGYADWIDQMRPWAEAARAT